MGVVMAFLVFVLERLVIRQIEKKQRAAETSSARSVTVGEE
jgi:hypothetical protein